MSQPRVLYQPASHVGDCDCACDPPPTTPTIRARYNAAADAIKASLADVEVELATLATKVAQFKPCQTLREARQLPTASRPMWPSQPTRMAMEARGNGDARYMYIYWPLNTAGAHTGPGGQRKTYIGVDRQDQALAQQMSTNHAAWLDASRAYETARQTLTYRVRDLERLAQECQTTAKHAQEATK